MTRYIGKRTLTGLLCIALSLCINFAIIHAAPGNPIRLLAGTESPSPEMIAALTEKYGLDQPIHIQFIRYVGNLLHGDMGQSIYTNEPVAREILDRLAPTIVLALSASLIALVLGTLLGIFCARHVGSGLDMALGSVSYLFDSTPSFWLGLMLILIFSSTLHLLPTSGMVDLRAGYTGLRRILDIAQHLILPGMSLSLTLIPYYFRIARSSVIQVMNEDFITTLRSTGMSEKMIFSKYIVKNAILPPVTMFGITLAFLVTGVTLVEIVFSWPGTGRLTLTAINQRDYPTLMGVYMVMSISVAVVMVLVDIAYAFLDPRIRYDK